MITAVLTCYTRENRYGKGETGINGEYLRGADLIDKVPSMQKKKNLKQITCCFPGVCFYVIYLCVFFFWCHVNTICTKTSPFKFDDEVRKQCCFSCLQHVGIIQLSWWKEHILWQSVHKTHNEHTSCAGLKPIPKPGPHLPISTYCGSVVLSMRISTDALTFLHPFSNAAIQSP